MDKELVIIRCSGGARGAKRAAWERVLDCWRASGLGLTEFGRRHGIPAKRLFKWRAKLRPGCVPVGGDALTRGGIACVRPGFVELEAIGPAGVCPAPLELHLGDARVVLRGGCDASLLRMLLGVLREGEGKGTC